MLSFPYPTQQQAYVVGDYVILLAETRIKGDRSIQSRFLIFVFVCPFRFLCFINQQVHFPTPKVPRYLCVSG